MLRAGTMLGDMNRLWRGNGLNLAPQDEKPAIQGGFDLTHMGQHRFIRTERYQDTPPSNLGRLLPIDHIFAQANGDIRPNENIAEHPAGDWQPLYAEKDIIDGEHKMQYENDFLTEHGPVEGVLLMRRNIVHQTTGMPYTIPIHRPPVSGCGFKLRGDRKRYGLKIL